MEPVMSPRQVASMLPFRVEHGVTRLVVGGNMGPGVLVFRGSRRIRLRVVMLTLHARAVVATGTAAAKYEATQV
jgi:hypothetical protein